MDIFSCESQMTAASLVLGWEHTQMILSPTTFGLDMGQPGPNNNEPELDFPDTNIYLLFFKFFMFPSLLRCLVSEGFNKLFMFYYIIASKWPLVTFIQKSVVLQQGCHHPRRRTE